MLALVEACRPRRWVENLFVAAPLVFAKRLDDPLTSLRALGAVALFCALSSAVYLWNDVVDVDSDRQHPIKQLRAIASGRLAIGDARIAAATLAAGALALGLVIDARFATVAFAYGVVNVAYSLWLKHVVYVDVLAIASGFLLRVTAGAFAVRVSASPYLLVCTGLLASYLGVGKRAHELALAGDRAALQRAVLESYRADVLRGMLVATGVATFVAYVLYTRAEHTVAFFGSAHLLWTAPFAAYGLYRFYGLASAPSGDSPTEEMLEDDLFIVNLLAWAAVTTLIIYSH